MSEQDYTDFTHWETTPERRKELDVGDIFMNQVECLTCGWIIRSKNRHHVAYCKCGATSVDGGSWYVKTTPDAIVRTLRYKYPHGRNDNG